MRHPLNYLFLATALLVASSIAAQLEKVGFVTTSFKNPTSKGSTNLTVQVHYPATTSGKNATLKKIAGGWPVLVFLHGYTVPASSYTRAADHIAARGYVVVINDTGRFDPDVQAADGIALYSTVASENGSTCQTGMSWSFSTRSQQSMTRPAIRSPRPSMGSETFRCRRSGSGPMLTPGPTRRQREFACFVNARRRTRFIYSATCTQRIFSGWSTTRDASWATRAWPSASAPSSESQP